MRGFPAALLASSALLLAACEGGSAGANTAEEETSAQPTVQQGVPENLQDDPRNEAVPLDLPPTPVATSESARLQTFPASFRGRWGLVAADCQPGRPDAKGLMEVGPTTLRFYESRGTARRMAEPRPGRIEAALSFTGEGQTWERTEALTLSRDGLVLVRQGGDPPASLRYNRCPEPR